MFVERELSILSHQFARAGASPAISGRCSTELCVLYVEGSLRVPLGRELRHAVRQVLQQRERSIVVDLARVSTIDAAGVGQLVRVYNMTRAAQGQLRIENANRRVRELLERAGLFGVLTAVTPRQCRRQSQPDHEASWCFAAGQAQRRGWAAS